MSSIPGNSRDTWLPVITANTTMAGYWLNWRFFLCAIWVLISMSVALFLILKNEKCPRTECIGEDGKEETEESELYDDECWRPCLKGIHPAWLLAFRVLAFVVLVVLLAVVVLVDGGSIFYYYTQWTFTSVTLYFLLGSILSGRGCYQHHRSVSGERVVDNVEVDAEQGSYATSSFGEISSVAVKEPIPCENHSPRKPADRWGLIFQVMFQMNAGAVMLTDCVFWFILVPFLAIKNYHLSALVISMHSINAIFLLGDAALNSLKFPWFRMAYFFLWTITYVLFQWIVHACVKLWWPYPFLDLSSSYAPLWYFSVAVMHIPCYGLFAFVIKLKHTLFPRWFPSSYKSLG